MKRDREDFTLPVGTHHNGDFKTYMTHKREKLQALHKPDPSEILSGIFRNCVFHVNGYTSPPLEELRRLVIIHGGNYSAYDSSSVTHTVSEHLTDAQLKVHKPGNNNNKRHWYVRPNWITESIEKRNRLEETYYQPIGLKRGVRTDDIKSFLSHNAITNRAISLLTPQQSSFMNDKVIETIELLTPEDKDIKGSSANLQMIDLDIIDAPSSNENACYLNQSLQSLLDYIHRGDSRSATTNLISWAKSFTTQHDINNKISDSIDRKLLEAYALWLLHNDCIDFLQLLCRVANPLTREPGFVAALCKASKTKFGVSLIFPEE